MAGRRGVAVYKGARVVSRAFGVTSAENRARAMRAEAFKSGYALGGAGGELPAGVTFTLAPHYVNGFNHGAAHASPIKIGG